MSGDIDFQTIIDGLRASRVAPVNCIVFNGTSTPLAASATYTSASRDGGATDGGISSFSYFNLFVLASHAGTASIEGSWDGTTWFAVSSAAIVAATALNLRVPVTFRYYRGKVVNGATLQTSMQVNASYTAA